MNKLGVIFFCLFIATFLPSCKTNKDFYKNQITEYIPEDKELYNTILTLDKNFFAAYNRCDLEEQANTYSDDIEFYHDQGGLMTSKKDIIDGTEKNICGKVTRALVAGSVEVYPIKGYGAVEIGYHKFHNREEPNAASHPSKFIIMWQNDHDNWKITKVISLH